MELIALLFVSIATKSKSSDFDWSKQNEVKDFRGKLPYTDAFQINKLYFKMEPPKSIRIFSIPFTSLGLIMQRTKDEFISQLAFLLLEAKYVTVDLLS